MFWNIVDKWDDYFQNKKLQIKPLSMLLDFTVFKSIELF